MRKTTTILAVAMAAGLAAGASGAVAAQDAESGYTFTRLTSPSEDHQLQLGGIAEVPSGVIAVVGGGGDSGYVWSSTDGGQTWTETAHEAYGIAALGDNFVTYWGTSPWDAAEGSSSSVIQTSPDGVAWEEVADIEGAVVQDIIETDDGLALLGMDFREVDGFSGPGGYPTLWTSSDAATWEASEIATPIYTREDDPLGLVGIARSADGAFLATGVANVFDQGEDGPPAKVFHVYHSPDGIEWTRATSPVPDTDTGVFGTMSAPVWTGAGFLVSAITADEAAPHGLFLTDDGSSWEQVADIPGPDIPTWVGDGSTTVGFRLPFTETDPPALTEGAMVYVSTDGRTWEHPSSLMIEGGHVWSAAMTADGRILAAGVDISECRESFCVFAPGNGAFPALWVGESR